MNLIQDVIDLDVFDEKGKLVTQIKTVNEGTLSYSNNSKGSFLVIRDVCFNIKMLEKIGKKDDFGSVTDFEKASRDNGAVIKFKANNSNAKFKLIGKGIIHDIETGKISHDFKVIIPNAELTEGYDLNLSISETHQPVYTFELLPFNTEEEIFELHLNERV